MSIRTRVGSPRKPRRLLTGTAMLVLAAISCSPVPEQGESEVGEKGVNETGTALTAAQPADVEAAVDGLVDAWEREDLESAVGVFTAEAVVYDPAWPPGKFEGAEEISTWTSGHFEAFEEIDLDLTDPSVQTVGRVAWFQARYVLSAQSAQPGGESTRGEGYLSIIWVKQEDGSYKSPLFHGIPRP